MKQFEDDVAKMIENIKFRNYSDKFINMVEEDKKRIRTSQSVFNPGDKTRNMYEMSAPAYNKLVTENVTKTYKLADINTAKYINTKLKDIACHLNIANHIEPMAKTPAFISIKDHKENFNSNPQCRLSNPAESNLGIVSKTIPTELTTTSVHKPEVINGETPTILSSGLKRSAIGTNTHFLISTSQNPTLQSLNTY